jgi:fatty-acyl-CoA synthase
VYELTQTAPFITVCAPLPEHADLSLADRAVVKARPPRRLRGGAANLSR